MKKLFLFLAMAGTAFFTSCSDDDQPTPTPEPVATAIVLTANVTTIDLGEAVTLTVMNDLAQNVTSTSTFTANNTAISGATFTPTAAGTFTLKATNGTLVSNNVVITVNPVAELNSIFVNNTNNTVTNSATVFWGGWAEDPNATEPTHGLFSMVAVNGTGDILDALMDPTSVSNYIDVEFIVPLDADGYVQFPTMANIEYLDIYEAHVNNTEVNFTSQQGGSLTFATELPETADSPFAFEAAADYNNNAALELNYDGNWAGIFNASGGRPAQSKTIKAKVISKADLMKSKNKFFSSLKK